MNRTGSNYDTVVNDLIEGKKFTINKARAGSVAKSRNGSMVSHPSSNDEKTTLAQTPL